MSDDVLDRLTATLADRYTIERELGSGGMATVYLAEDLKHHGKVAVKVLRPELAAVIGADGRFLLPAAREEPDSRSHLRVVTNWLGEIERLVREGNR